MLIAPAPELPTLFCPRTEVLGEDIHVWMLPGHDAASSSTKQEDAYWALLSKDELERARRFHFAHHANDFVANRARLRILLGSYLQRHPEELVFTYTEQGKPELSSESGQLSFNLSHTDGMALLAVSKHGRIGVDIEKMSSQSDCLELARSYFSKAELDALSALDSREQQAAFYRCWTRKEAFLKALGEGLSRPLSEFTVSIAQHSADLLECGWDEGSPHSWRIFPLEVPPGYAASLACEGISAGVPHLPKRFDGSQSL